MVLVARTTGISRLVSPICVGRLPWPERPTERMFKSFKGRARPRLLGRRTPRLSSWNFLILSVPNCGRSAYALRKALSHGGSQRVRVVFRNYPLSIHAHARAAAELGACIARQSSRAFWRFHDHLFEDQDSLAGPTFVPDSISYIGAEFPSLSASALKRCVVSGESAPDVERDIEMGRKFAVSGTPTLFINRTRPVGVRDSDSIRRLISLEEQRAASSATANAD